MKWKNKYKPKVWTDLMLPVNPNIRKIVTRLFTTGECSSSGLLLHDTVSDGGTGKTTFVEMFVEVSKWPVIRLDTTGERVGDLERLEKEIIFNKSTEGFFGEVPGLTPRRSLVIGHEISKSPRNYIDGLRDIMDRYDEDALFLFTDNDYAKLSVNNPQMFKNQRCVPLDWDTIPAEDIRNYCIRILQAEGADTPANHELVDRLIMKNKASIRGVIIGLENNKI